MNFSCPVPVVHRFVYPQPVLAGGARLAQTAATERAVGQGASRREEPGVLSREPNRRGAVRGRNDTPVKANRDFAAALPEKNERHEFAVMEVSQRRPVWRRERADVGPKFF